VLFGRYPEPGQAKTRLAATLGTRQTLLLYQALLADTAAKLAEVSACQPVAALTASRPMAEPPPDPLGRTPFATFRLEGQEGEDFGARLGSTMARVLDAGFGRVVLVGADSPELTVGDLEDAFQHLDHSGLVLGPAADGGYYLVGLRRFHPELFARITWSTSQVFQETCQVAEQLGLPLGIVQMRADIDYIADLQALAARRGRAWTAGEDSPCPATDGWLQGKLPGQVTPPLAGLQLTQGEGT